MKTTREQIWKDLMGNLSDKHAELVGSPLMPTQGIPRKDPAPQKAVIKTAQELEDDVLFEAFTGGAVEHPEAEKVATELRRTDLTPHVDITGLEPTPGVVEKKAQRYALPLDERYPLDGYDQVKAASAYFDQHVDEMPVDVRREYCLNMVKRASELGIPVSSVAAAYGSERCAESGHIKLCMDMRRTVITDETMLDVLDKVAGMHVTLSPATFAELVTEFDKLANIDQHYGSAVPDPYITVFKTAAQESKTDPKDAIVIGNEYLPARKLVEFSKLRNLQVTSRFGSDFADAFAKDPRGIFDSLPRDQKLVLMRMANNNDSSLEGASTS